MSKSTLNNVRISVFFLLYGLVSGCSAMQTMENCKLSSPPKESGVNGLHGTYVFVFPKNISDDYNGCQTVWDDAGNVWITIRFSTGVPTQLSAYPSKLTKEAFTCYYKNMRQIKTNPKACFDYNDIKNGFPSVEAHSKITIPKGKDPRK